MTLTKQQKDTLDYITGFTRENGVPPTLREIAGHFGWKAIGSAQDVVSALKRKGHLQDSGKGKARSLVSLQEIQQIPLLQVPLLGQVQAGTPVESYITPSTQLVSFPYPKKGSDEFFALRIEGFSMVGAGFFPQDMILVEAKRTAQNNEIVVASVNGETTVKRYAQKGSQLFRSAIEKLEQDNIPPSLLISENPDFSPIAFGGENDEIIGIVRSLYRSVVH